MQQRCVTKGGGVGVKDGEGEEEENCMCVYDCMRDDVHEDQRKKNHFLPLPSPLKKSNSKTKLFFKVLREVVDLSVYTHNEHPDFISLSFEPLKKRIRILTSSRSRPRWREGS